MLNEALDKTVTENCAMEFLFFLFKSAVGKNLNFEAVACSVGKKSQLSSLLEMKTYLSAEKLSMENGFTPYC